MSYLVIARKWRPKNFDHLIGQDHVKQTLINSLKNNRLHQALLFTGIRGTGKTSAARILAKSLKCTEQKEFHPCNECKTCKEISNGANLDVLEIDGASNNGVDAIRDLKNTLGYMPSIGKYKIYIIDEVHMLSTSAFNALLKTLEEPPPHVVFILATTEAHKIPNTILSRVQRFDFRRIPTREITNQLLNICQTENIEYDEDAIWTISRKSDGSMRDAQSLLDQIITFSDGRINLKKITDILGLTDKDLILKTLTLLIDKDEKSLLDVIEKIFYKGYDCKIFVQDLLEEIRNLLLIKIYNQQDSVNNNLLLDISDSEIEHLKNLSSKLSTEDIHLLFDMALKGVNDINRSHYPRIIMEILLLRMCNAPKVIDIISLIKIQPEKNSQKIPENTPEKNKNNKLTSNEESNKEFNERMKDTNNNPLKTKQTTNQAQWIKFIKFVQKENSLFAAKIENFICLKITNNSIMLKIPKKIGFLKNEVLAPEFQKVLKNYINSFFGNEFTFSIEMNCDDSLENLTAKDIMAQVKYQKHKELKDEVNNHPLVKSIKDIFDGEVTSISEQL